MLKIFKELNIKAKLMVTMSAVAGFFAVIITIIFTFKLNNTASVAQKESVRALVEILSHTVSSGLDFGDQGAVKDGFKALKSHEPLKYLIVYDIYGNVFAEYFKNPEEKDAIMELLEQDKEAITDDSEVSFEKMDMSQILFPILNRSKTQIGKLAMGVSTDTISAETRENIFFGIGVLIIAILSGVGVSLITSGVLTKRITEVLERIEDISSGEGDLTKRIDVPAKDELGKLGIAFNSFVDKLHELIFQIADSSTLINSSVNSISEFTSTVAKGAEKQSEQATTVAVSSEEMSATILQTSSNTADAVELSKKAQSAANQGRTVVDDTLKAMEAIAGVVSESGQTILELGKSVGQIGKIAQVIDDITDQINLLSLNASIEAAVAGEYGRGFAVVANEIKKLADRTTMSTKEIVEVIEKIQKNMANTVKAMERGTQEVEKGRNLGERTDGALNIILDSNNKLMEMITNISVATEQQSRTAEEISKHIEEIAGITNATAGGMREIDRSTEELVGQSKQLSHLISRFKLEENGKQDVEEA